MITAFHEGATAEEIIEQYPSLQLSDVYLERQHRAAEARQEAERRFNPVGVRERLLARRNQHR